MINRKRELAIRIRLKKSSNYIFRQKVCQTRTPRPVSRTLLNVQDPSTSVAARRVAARRIAVSWSRSACCDRSSSRSCHLVIATDMVTAQTAVSQPPAYVRRVEDVEATDTAFVDQLRRFHARLR